MLLYCTKKCSYSSDLDASIWLSHFKLLDLFSPSAVKKINEDKGDYRMLYFNQNATKKNSQFRFSVKLADDWIYFSVYQDFLKVKKILIFSSVISFEITSVSMLCVFVYLYLQFTKDNGTKCF